MYRVILLMPEELLWLNLGFELIRSKSWDKFARRYQSFFWHSFCCWMRIFFWLLQRAWRTEEYHWSEPLWSLNSEPLDLESVWPCLLLNNNKKRWGQESQLEDQSIALKHSNLSGSYKYIHTHHVICKDAEFLTRALFFIFIFSFLIYFLVFFKINFNYFLGANFVI